MKVLIINSMCGTGSTGVIVAGIYEALKADGHECKIVYGLSNATKVPSKDTYRMNNKLGYYAHNLLARFTDGAGYFSYIQTRKMIEYIKAYNPDIISLHNLHGFYINIPLLFRHLKRIQKPVVWTLHDCWSFTGHCAHFALIKCAKWKSQCNKCPQKNAYPKSYIDRSKYNFNKKKSSFLQLDNLTIVTPSKWLAELAKMSYFKDNDVLTINNGIYLDTFIPRKGSFRQKYNVSDDAVVLLSVASTWTKEKGIDDLIELSKLLDKRYKQVIVGLNEEQIKTLPPEIIGITRTANAEELSEIYSASDIFINTTYADTFPTVNIEALACGTPVITYPTGGSPEIVDQNTGIVTKERTPRAIISELDKALELSGDACRARAECFFERDKQFKEYVALFENLTK